MRNINMVLTSRHAALLGTKLYSQIDSKIKSKFLLKLRKKIKSPLRSKLLLNE